MKSLTIEQLIDQLANLGQVVGLDAKVEAWNINEAMQPPFDFLTHEIDP